MAKEKYRPPRQQTLRVVDPDKHPEQLLAPKGRTHRANLDANAHVDWTKVEAEYRAGVISISQIAARHKINSESTIRKRAIKYKWTRDLQNAVTTAVRAKAAAELAGIDPSKVSEMSEEDMVEHAAKAVVQVQTQQRTDIAEMRQRTMTLGRYIDDIIKETSKPNGELKKEHLLALGKDGLIGAHESISRSYDRIANLERKAYGLDRGQVDPTPEKAGSALERILGRLAPPDESRNTPRDEPEGA